MEDNLKKKVTRSLTWVGSVNFASQIVSWGMTILVVRQLSPNDYGLMAMAMVFVGFLTMIGDFGLFASIVQKQDITQGQLRETFGFIIALGVCFFLATFFGAPLVSAFYSEGRIISILRTLSFVFFLIPFYIIPHSLLLRDMDFRKTSLIEMCCNLVAASTSLFFALMGYGVWALVYGALSLFAARTICFLGTSKTFYKPIFGFKEIKTMLSFSGFFTASTVLRYFFFKADLIVGGKVLGAGPLGIYTVANQLAFTPLEKISGIVPQVAFPAFSKLQSNASAFAANYLKGLKFLNLIVFPGYASLIILAPDIVHILLGPKWYIIIEPMRILCLIMPLRAIDVLFIPAMNGLGKSHINTLTGAFSFFVMICSFLIGLKWGYIGLCWAWVAGFTIIYIFMVIVSMVSLKISVETFISSYKAALIGSLAIAIPSVIILYSFDIGILPLTKIIIVLALSLCVYLVTIYWTDKKILIELKGILNNISK